MKQLPIVIAGLCLAVTASLLLSGTPSSGQNKDELQWMGFNEGVKKAKAEKKFVIVDFYADWCKYCKDMERETFSDAEVRAHMRQGYVLVRVHMDKNHGEQILFGAHKLTKKELAGMMQVEGLPTVVFLDREGGFIGGIPGFHKKDTFLPLLKYIRMECYKKKVRFNDYLNNAAACG